MAESEILRMFKKVFWQGRSERDAEAYSSQYVEALSDARTQPEAFFNIRRKGGRPESTGILRSAVHVELSGSRKSSGNM